MGYVAKCRKVVLCVAHERPARLFFKIALCDHIVVARNAFEALRALHNRAFDIIAIDSRLPDWSGLALCRTIRRFDRDTPILYLHSNPQDMARGYAAGAQGCVSRQFDARVLLSTARALLESGGGMRLPPAPELH
jgi:DNA-binding response OmpR family regulator